MNNQKNILIINSLRDEAKRYVDSISEILGTKFKISVKPDSCRDIRPSDGLKLSNCRIHTGPALNFGKKFKNSRNIIFLILFPFLFIYNFIILFKLARKHGLEKLILSNWNEKMVLSTSAKILGIAVYWLELKCLNKKYFASGPARYIGWLYRTSSKNAKIITASNFISDQLINWMIDQDRICVIRPSIKVNTVEYQENIFESMAKKDYLKKQRKFFTVGVICRLDDSQRIESVFTAVNSCLATIPNMQLIIVGDGPEKKNLIWLSKKMGVENVVWFVGGQDRPKKWLDSFDIFIMPLVSLKITDYYSVLEAMSAGLPVIAPKNFGLEDMIAENRAGALLEFDHPEMISSLIIKLEQNQSWRRELGKNAKERIASDFTLERMAASFSEIIN